jgi:tRNA(Ile)-lysidine synthase
MGALGPWPRRPRIAAAVSGGSDSLALALLAQEWAAARGGALLCLIVDHGLRAESAAEAEGVRIWLGARGVEAEILRAPADQDASGSLQERARRLRYRLLIERCREFGIAYLLLAHHRDDQAETVLMRLVRGSGVRGLAGIVPSALAPESAGRLRLLRPLLQAPKLRLRATLEAMGQEWIEDPSNRDLRHERVRWRRLMPLLEAGGVDAGRLAAAAARLGDERGALDRAAASWLAAAAMPSGLGHVVVDLNGYPTLAPAIAEAALARLLGAVGGGGYPPRRESLSALAEALRRGVPGDLTRTLGGCVLTLRGARVTVTREPSAVSEISTARPGLLLWDGRFEMRIEGAADRLQAIRVAALGASGLAELRKTLREKGLRLPQAPARQLQTLPALWECRRLLEAPHLPAYGRFFATSVAWAPRQPLTG